MEKFLSKFQGKPLRNEQIAQGMYLCFRNAKELMEDATLLKRHKRYARALSLSVLALEELAKIPLLLNAVLLDTKDQKTWKNLWKILRSHAAKQEMWSVYGRGLARMKSPAAVHYDDRYPAGLQPLLDKFKQCGFYVTYFDDEFVLPASFASDNLKWVDYTFKLATKRLRGFSALHATLRRSQRVVTVTSMITIPEELKAKLAESISNIASKK